MSITLSHNAYGKSRVLLTKVTRHPDRHDLKEISVDIQLEGEFSDSFTRGDNTKVIPTDTMKNTVYALAKNHPLTDLEGFGQALARHFMGFPPVAKATIHLEEQPWQRIGVRGKEHSHAFMSAGTERRTCSVINDRQSLRVVAGIDGVLLLKTTNSTFRGFLRDSYTTLAETDDRILAAMLQAQWEYETMPADCNRCFELTRRTLVEVFANHESLGVQQTLHAMGAAALEACPEVEEITLTMANKHRLAVDLQPFGLENRNEILVPTDEPFGQITGTLRRV
jgi:urate oxidase